MNLRERVKKAFHRHSNSVSSRSKGNAIKIEYYKRGEVPPSKFRGPFDPEHQKQLAAWSFEGAMAYRSRSIDVSLSPCTTLPESFCPLDTSPLAQLPLESRNEAVDDLDPCDGSTSSSPDDNYTPDRQEDSGSQSSATAIGTESSSGSLSTLLPDSLPPRRDSIAQIKESIRHTSPVVWKCPPPATTARTNMLPFSPEDLASALNTAQLVCA